jgi:hypothetical protein
VSICPSAVGMRASEFIFWTSVFRFRTNDLERDKIMGWRCGDVEGGTKKVSRRPRSRRRNPYFPPSLPSLPSRPSRDPTRRRLRGLPKVISDLAWPMAGRARCPQRAGVRGNGLVGDDVRSL